MCKRQRITIGYYATRRVGGPRADVTCYARGNSATVGSAWFYQRFGWHYLGLASDNFLASSGDISLTLRSA